MRMRTSGVCPFPWPVALRGYSVLIKQTQQVGQWSSAPRSWEDTFEMLPGKLKMQAEITVEK